MGQKIGKTAAGGKENKPNRLHRSIPPLRGHRQAITALLHPNREISLDAYRYGWIILGQFTRLMQLGYGFLLTWQPQPMNQQNLSALIGSVADLLRGDYKQSEYGRVILPFTVLRRLDCVLTPSKEAVLQEKAAQESAGLNPEPFLLRTAKLRFVNTSPLERCRPTSSARCYPTPPMPGSIPTKPKSAMRSPLTAISTSSSHRVHWPRLTGS